jgi:NADPH-ferrihemoprotein reductase
MSVCTELRSETETGSTVHLEIDIKGSGLQYQTADNLAVLHENTPEAVEKFATTCGGFDLDQHVVLEAAEGVEDFKHPFPSPCSARHLLTHYVDIQGIPRKSVLAQFNAYLSDKAQQEWLKGITSIAQKEHYSKEIEQEGRSFVSLLATELSSCRIPLEDLLHILPTIQPRDYTIASSSSVHPHSIHLTVSITERISPSGVKVEGLCSNFLKRLISTGSHSCKMFVRESSFRLPKSLATPIVMIGPGSGIAPMRALLQERRYLAEKEKKSDVVNVLYFGCRSRDVDYLYRDELVAAENDGSLTSLQLAFSREQSDKVYVQDVMQRPENASSLCRLVLEEGAHVYVCGATGMGQSVHEAFAQIISKEKGVTVAAANEIIKGMQKKHTYVQELWSV